MPRTLDSIIEALEQPLDWERVKTRVGAGNMSLSYLEGFDVIGTLNHIFGYDGWEVELIQPPTLVVQGENFVSYQAAVKLTIWFWALSAVGPEINPPLFSRSKTATGVGQASGRDRIAAETHEKGIKESETDALKRAARMLGEQFGNTLYDKDVHSARAATTTPASNVQRPQRRTT